MNHELAVYEESLRGLIIRIYNDEIGRENPYKEYDQLSDVVTWTRNYEFSSEEVYSNPTEVIEAFDRGEVVWCTPLMAYIHSGITVRLWNCGNWPDQQWDCGLAGYVYVTKKKAKEEFPNYGGRTLWLACNKRVEDEVETLDDWLTGNIWGYEIENEEGEVVDSCWGFYGDYRKNVLIVAREQLKYFASKENEYVQS